MQSLVNKIIIISIAAALMGGGISTVAIAADNHKEAGQEKLVPRDMMPRGMANVMQDLALTDAQKEQLKAIKAKREALKDEYWAVFSEEQKTTMLKKLSHYRRVMHNKNNRGKPHLKHNERDGKRWQQKQR